jgi:hypothetical protein
VRTAPPRRKRRDRQCTRSRSSPLRRWPPADQCGYARVTDLDQLPPPSVPTRRLRAALPSRGSSPIDLSTDPVARDGSREAVAFRRGSLRVLARRVRSRDPASLVYARSDCGVPASDFVPPSGSPSSFPHASGTAVAVRQSCASPGGAPGLPLARHCRRWIRPPASAALARSRRVLGRLGSPSPAGGDGRGPDRVRCRYWFSHLDFASPVYSGSRSPRVFSLFLTDALSRRPHHIEQGGATSPAVSGQQLSTPDGRVTI